MEIEIKYKINSVLEIRKKLKSIDAKKISKNKECDFYFDHKDKPQNISVIRLRKLGAKALFTIKEKQKNCKYFKVKSEKEFEVSSFKQAKEILESLGFSVCGGKEKTREIFKYKNVLICLDKLKDIGFFLEIEGSKKDIIEVSKLLGFNYKEDGITCSYDKLIKT